MIFCISDVESKDGISGIKKELRYAALFLVPSTRLGLFFCGNDSRNGDVFYGDVFGEENFDNIVQRKFERAIIGKGINQAGGRFCRDVEPFCRTAVPIVMEHSGNKKQPARRQAV